MAVTALQTEVLLAGQGEGRILKLDRPISFWGGVDPETGRITAPDHAQRGETVAGRVLVLPGTIGSSSSAAVLLELIAGRRAPAALILGRTDAILLLGIVVAKEMALDPRPPALLLPPAAQAALQTGLHARLGAKGLLEVTLPDTGV